MTFEIQNTFNTQTKLDFLKQYVLYLQLQLVSHTSFVCFVCFVWFVCVCFFTQQDTVKNNREMIVKKSHFGPDRLNRSERMVNKELHRARGKKAATTTATLHCPSLTVFQHNQTLEDKELSKKSHLQTKTASDQIHTFQSNYLP